MKLERWKEDIIQDSLDIFMQVVDANLNLLRSKDLQSLRSLAFIKYKQVSRVEEENKRREDRLVNIAYDCLEKNLQSNNWYCFDDAFYATLRHYGIREA